METDQLLYSLAPLELLNHRGERYQGGDLFVPLATLLDEDQELLRALYQYLLELLARLSSEPGAAELERLAEFLREQPAESTTHLAARLGKASYRARPSELLAKTLHDLRGGALTPLLGQLQLARQDGLELPIVRRLFYLTRDHLKIMRHAVHELDVPRFREDLLLRVHRTNLIVEKWHGALWPGSAGPLRVEVQACETTAISACCVEFGSVDRILYNLLNNACRHSASVRVDLHILRVPDASGHNVRFVVVNSISPAEQAHLQTLSLPQLFELGTSTTGSGCGLAIAADFVARAYGLGNSREAVQDGYLGATVRNRSFLAWFHWPRVMEENVPVPPDIYTSPVE